MQQFDSFAQMQRDAERRVMEMQQRAMHAVEHSDPPPMLNAVAAQQSVDDGEAVLFDENPSSEPEEQAPHSGSALRELLPGLNLSDEEAERALLLSILLLIREQADRNLLFLLLYLMI